MRTAAKRVLGSKKRKPSVKLKSKSGGTKIKLKIKAKSPEALGKAVDKLAKGIGKG
jgi:hypothetical protein